MSLRDDLETRHEKLHTDEPALKKRESPREIFGIGYAQAKDDAIDRCRMELRGVASDEAIERCIAAIQALDVRHAKNRRLMEETNDAVDLGKFARDLAAKQEPLGEEFEQVLQDNLWELYAKS